MDINIPIKKSRTYTEFCGVRIEPQTKKKMKDLDALTDTDVTVLIREAIKEAIDKAHALKLENKAS